MSLRPGTVGILPAGALGVAFFYHLTGGLARQEGRVYFVERRGSASARSLRECPELCISTLQGEKVQVPTQEMLMPDLVTCFKQGFLPEVLLACPNPDQLLDLVTTAVELVEELYAQGHLLAAPLPLPWIVLCSNGIYFQRLRQVLIEKLEESTLFGRLPDLWPELMPQIVGRLLRGVTVQTGLREGSGADTIYRPGPRSRTKLGGGDAQGRERCWQILTELGGWFEIEARVSPTRLEFDKGLVNMACNLLGQLWAIDEAGSFQLLTLNQILLPIHEQPMRELIYQVLQIGRALKVYDASDDVDTLYERVREVSLAHGEHVPSSLQWVGMMLHLGKLEPQITPTESWLVDPLIRYAMSAGLEEAELYFRNLKILLVEKLTRAIEATRSCDPVH
ncbi:hypothetical protein [Anthocerotibacter panamensis]|uniref:hypothetical protein n=1 Tax=Anthocerotibacter panamensis TaxID=2857077 RepID=UPI001C4028F4|nr:hypothetical protein [Anthocerotibacter panamensis]